MVSGWYKMKNIPGTVGKVLLIMLAVAALYAGNLFLKPVSTIKASLAQLSPAAPLNTHTSRVVHGVGVLALGR